MNCKIQTIFRNTGAFTAVCFLSILFFSYTSRAAGYYVDSRGGNDTNTGKSTADAWKSLSKVSSRQFIPGDTIFFRRGSVWTGQLTINISGTQSRPIIFTAYDSGADPVIRNPGIDNGSAILINADWVVVENFLVREAHQAGIYITRDAGHNIVRNNEATQVGIGIAVHGKHNLITHNYAHDLTMVRNTRGGDDDFGAVGIWLFSSNNEVSYNRMVNCKAPSYDYGYDGGVVEFYGNVDSCYIHHNMGENCDGSFEVGGQRDTLSHNLIAYNVYINNGVSGGFHVGGTFGVFFEDMRVENNVFIDTGTSDYAIGFWNGNPASVDIQYRNNIIFAPDYKRVSNYSGFVHQYNLFYLGGKKDPDFTPGTGDKIGDPLFIDPGGKNFHLKADSPAIDAGTNMGYHIDFDGNPVPNGNAPDIGAYEYNHN